MPRDYILISSSGLLVPLLSLKFPQRPWFISPGQGRSGLNPRFIPSFLSHLGKITFASLSVRFPIYRSKVINSMIVGELLWSKMHQGEVLLQARIQQGPRYCYCKMMNKQGPGPLWTGLARILVLLGSRFFKFILLHSLHDPCHVVMSLFINPSGELPDGPVVRTHGFPCWGLGFNLWLGS